MKQCDLNFNMSILISLYYSQYHFIHLASLKKIEHVKYQLNFDLFTFTYFPPLEQFLSVFSSVLGTFCVTTLSMACCDYLELDDNFSGPFPSFQVPQVKGYFSLDSTRNFCDDISQLKYISFRHDSKEVSFDLNHKLNEAIMKEEGDEKLDNLLKGLQHRSLLQHDSELEEIVCYRGLLTRLMCTPYEEREGWIINATKWRGVIYLCESETPANKQKRMQCTPREKRFTAWGYKFEQYMVSEKPGVQPNTKVPNNQNEEFCVIFRTKLSNHRIVYGAEMDGVESDSVINNLEELRKAEFLELKTSRQIEHPRQLDNFRKYKLLKWWCQSFLVGIMKILCGFRDDRGIVHRVQKYDVSSLPKEAKGVWNPAVCMHFCDRFLTFVKRVVKEEDPLTVWSFEWQASDTRISARKVPGPSDYSFLHKWYTEMPQM